MSHLVLRIERTKWKAFGVGWRVFLFSIESIVKEKDSKLLGKIMHAEELFSVPLFQL